MFQCSNSAKEQLAPRKTYSMQKMRTRCEDKISTRLLRLDSENISNSSCYNNKSRDSLKLNVIMQCRRFIHTTIFIAIMPMTSGSNNAQEGRDGWQGVNGDLTIVFLLLLAIVAAVFCVVCTCGTTGCCYMFWQGSLYKKDNELNVDKEGRSGSCVAAFDGSQEVTRGTKQTKSTARVGIYRATLNALESNQAAISSLAEAIEAAPNGLANVLQSIGNTGNQNTGGGADLEAGKEEQET